MKNGIQDIIKAIGTDGCYALCLIEIAQRLSGKHFDIVQEICYAIDQKWIYFNFKNLKDVNQMRVDAPAKFLSGMIGKKVTVEKFSIQEWKEKFRENPDYFKGCEYIDKWYNKYTGFSHFVTPTFNGLLDSKTMKEGVLEAYRVVKVGE